jgi:hypothetical protein
MWKVFTRPTCASDFFSERSKVNFSKFLKGENFENIIEKLIRAKFQLFTTFLTFFKKISEFFRKPLKGISKNSEFEYAIPYLN